MLNNTINHLEERKSQNHLLQNTQKLHMNYPRLKKFVLTAIYTLIQKSENFWSKKEIKVTKPKHAFKDFASSYNVKSLNSFNPELHLKDTEFAK